MGTDAAATRILVATWLALVLACATAYLVFAEPFDGTWRAYTSRVLSPLTALLLVVSLVQRQPDRRP